MASVDEISIPSGKARFLMLATSFTPEVRIAPKGLLEYNLSTTRFFLDSENELDRFLVFLMFGWTHVPCLSKFMTSERLSID